ncbi:MAG: DUF5131 family protein [Chloroflexi bacterium]|nr:DUF5131 family protein [Chloroflexota bacterium]
MGERTNIGWTDRTFNPWIGCTKVSPGCDDCYAEVLNNRFHHVDGWGISAPRKRTSPANWRKPIAWNREALAEGVRLRVFCASMADVFDAQVPEEWRADLWALIRATPALDWQLLTKRTNRIEKCLPSDWGDGWPHVWLGASVETASHTWRLDHLVRIPAIVRFVSVEPLLGPVDLRSWLQSIDWVIVGGESGAHFRPMDIRWMESIAAQCDAAGVAVFVKQDAAPRSEQQGRLPDALWNRKAFPAPRRPSVGADNMQLMGADCNGRRVPPWV